ncbi:right-handed parallel beta-helix repeat-containing protein [Candidatus Acetothermia bacterium]|nr:right-handed parallel beta-helix repeat-containing protein [Candidatus Acetothermia bacterium]MBI3643793.1 right-handed parallel beta-helix repeat-containing protein [Candidatus Acetothermia bacterium]
MVGKVSKQRWRLAVSFGLLSLAIFSHPLPAQVTHQSPPLVVDATSAANEDTDGDNRFKSIQGALSSPQLDEYATISVKPGRYTGDLVINKEGVKLESTGGAPQTIIDGRIEIRARNVQIIGFSIEAGANNTAVTIEGEGALLKNNKIYEAAHGVDIEGVNSASVKQNQIYNHTGDALIVKDAWDVEFVENELRGNEGAGASVEGAHNLTFNKNLVTFNRFGGLWVKDSQQLAINENSIQDNDIVGLSLDGSSGGTIQKNQFLSNEVGMVLTSSMDNTIEDNVMKQGRSAGLVVKNEAHGNTFKNNTIQGNQGKGSTGIRLAGNVFDNEFVKNQVSENGAGLVLAQNENGTPSNNIFEENEFTLSDSQGIQIDPVAQRNRFIKNNIHQNLEEGIANSGDATIFEQNEISQNGTVGLLLQNSKNASAQGNSIKENGDVGVLMKSSSGVLLSENKIMNNVRDGVQISGSDNLRLLSNVITNNGSGGLRVEDASHVSALNNTIQDNSEQGATFSNVQHLEMQENKIISNGLGGVSLDKVNGADLDSNQFSENTRYGLLSSNSTDVSASRNFWGDPQGPSGAFTGHGNAALGVDMGQVTPWLPAKPDDLDLHSVSGKILDSPEGPRIEFDATDRLGMILELFKPGLNGKDLASMAIVLAARYHARPQSAPPLEKEIGFYNVSVDGLNTGVAEITFMYREEDEPAGLDPSKLQIFLYKNGAWVPMPGTVSPGLRRVTGEIPIEYLNGGLIGLGTLGNSKNQVLQSPGQPQKKKNLAPLTSLKGPRPPMGDILLLMLFAVSPWLLLIAFYSLVRAVRRGTPARRRVAHIFRIWNL